MMTETQTDLVPCVETEIARRRKNSWRHRQPGPASPGSVSAGTSVSVGAADAASGAG